MSVTLEGLSTSTHWLPHAPHAAVGYRTSHAAGLGSQLGRRPHHKGFTGTAHCYTSRTKDPHRGIEYCQGMMGSCFRMICLLQSKTFPVRGKTNVCSWCVRQPLAATPTLALSLCEGNHNLCLRGSCPWPCFHPGLGMWCWVSCTSWQCPGAGGCLGPGQAGKNCAVFGECLLAHFSSGTLARCDVHLFGLSFLIQKYEVLVHSKT